LKQFAVAVRWGGLFGVVVLGLASLIGSGGGGAGGEEDPPAETVQAPSITTQPQPASVVAGQTAQFSVIAAGSAPLTYQWLRNGTELTGAAAAQYTTPALATADSGARYTVRVSNAAGSLTSTDAVLTVTATAVAPVITTQPQAATVTIGQTATFIVAATGTSPLTYQWRRNGVDIARATAASYTTPTLTAADNGAVVSVRVANAAGAVVSSSVLLAVQAASSPLAGKAWSPGQLLEIGDDPVVSRAAGIDDAGRVTVAFIKTETTRSVLYVTRGTPNAASVAPSWTPPVAIDQVLGAPPTGGSASGVSLDVSPAGNVAVLFRRSAPCAATTYSTTGSCGYYYVSRYLREAATWESPVLLGDSPGSFELFGVRINDQGDIAVKGIGWARYLTSSHLEVAAVWRRPRTNAGFSQQQLGVPGTLVPLSNAILSLDEAGNLLVAGTMPPVALASEDLVAYRGSISSGLGPAVILHQHSAAPKIVAAGVGRAGQQAVVWRQTVGVGARDYVATSSGPTATWQLAELPSGGIGSRAAYALVLGDDASTRVFDLTLNRYWSVVAGVPGSPITLPPDTPGGRSGEACVIARTGDRLCISGGQSWSTFDASTSRVVSPYGDPILGRDTFVLQGDIEVPMLSVGGVGFVSLRNRHTALPTPGQPAGTEGAATNLWGVFLK